nr:hypothetical protein [Tanacetum cinerariifolium]
MMRNDEQLCNADLVIWLSLKIKFEKITTATACRPSAIRPRDHEDYQDDDARPKGDNSAKRQKMFKHGTYSFGELSFGQVMKQEPNLSGLGTQEQLDEFDAWMEDAETNDDEVPDDKVSQELLEEMSGEIDETQLQKAVDSMLRQRCNSGEEHQYHNDQMQNYLKSDIIWESKKERKLPPTGSTETNPRDHAKSILTIVEVDSYLIRRMGSSQYAISTGKNRTVLYETKQMTILFASRLNDCYCEDKKGSYGPQFLEAYYEASHINNSIPRKGKDLGSFTLPCFTNNVCFDNAIADLGASVSVMPLLTYLNLGLGELDHTKLTVELADRTVKYPKGIVENMLVGIGKFVFPVDFIIF